MSNIQQARDILAKWRSAAATGRWDLKFDWAQFTAESSPEENGYVGDTENPYDARLIVGIAGNPDLLNAIDGLLTHGQSAVTNPMNEFGVRDWADRIATAIIAADERMTSA